MIEILLLVALYVLAMAIFCLAASRLPILSEEAQHRVSSLDGLRGILATAVLAHHFTVSYYWHATSIWQMTDSRVINNLGAVPVSLFFMITGYLFGGKVYRGVPRWTAIASSRIRRIFPMYLTSVVIVVVVAFYQQGGQLGSLLDFTKSIGHWLVFIGVPFNGIDETRRINAGVQWTLLYEAVFYLSLPLLYCLLRRRLAVAAVVISIVALALLWPLYGQYFSNNYIKLFVAGIVVAILEDWLKARAIDYARWPSTLVALAVLVLCMALKPYSKAQMIILAIPFALFVLGNSLNSLLENRGLKILGEASFSIYLLHGIVIYVLFSVFSIYDFQAANFLHYVWFLPLVLWLVASLSVATYWGIERPFIRQRPRPAAPVTAV
ncbi:acyltransferase [Pseudomonas sp. M47T1]|uniref:acyltransferase family protein n=1 Tax=unclassified Pseudomonas TaxID=196821 RepID=UPI00026074EF|nr:acyltransferase [Pseudomonas sp. M47T1]EIK98014.1 acyltransferase [Pseudomonas sp. M47T1]